VKDKKMAVAPKLTIDEFRALTSFKDKIENILKNDLEIMSFFCMCVIVVITSIKRLLTPCIAFAGTRNRSAIEMIWPISLTNYNSRVEHTISIRK
jgi:hypothetical protein